MQAMIINSQFSFYFRIKQTINCPNKPFLNQLYSHRNLLEEKVIYLIKSQFYLE